jgi:PH (Pleckstrin Homology) domain-containing protein
MSTRFKSKVDTWIGTILAGCLILSAGAFVVMIRVAVPLAALIMAVGIGIPASLLLCTDYTVENEVLLVRSGLFRSRIPLKDIVSIGPTRNPMSSPALSLDRLLITRRNGSDCMISPRDKEGFLQELRNHGVEAIGL